MSSSSNNNDDVVIVTCCRTPLCRAGKGALNDVPITTLLSTVLSECVVRTHNKVDFSDIQDVCVGNVLGGPESATLFRMAQLSAGFPDSSSLSTTNRQCSSGLQAVCTIANSIKSGHITIGIGCGVESMSHNSMKNVKMPESLDWSVFSKAAMDCLTPMGVTSDNVVRRYGLCREKLDEFSVESHRKASEAQQSHKFDSEIVAVNDVSKDDGVRSNTTLERLAKLPPVFTKDGVTTAGNSSQMTDGAAAVLLMTREEANRRHLPILGVWRGFSVAGVPPAIMGIGPAVAIPAVLSQCNLSKDDIGVFEINEAFASQATFCIDHLELDYGKVNPNGGAIALGHPLGCTGARQICTLLYELHRRKERYGVVSMCIGTGMGAAAVIEIEPQSSM